MTTDTQTIQTLTDEQILNPTPITRVERIRIAREWTIVVSTYIQSIIKIAWNLFSLLLSALVMVGIGYLILLIWIKSSNNINSNDNAKHNGITIRSY